MARNFFVGALLCCVVFGCQKATLIEGEDASSRSEGTELNDSTGTVTPSFNQEDWAGEDNVEFEFGAN